MGLDITAYSNLKHIGLHYDGEWCEDDTHISAYAFDCFGQSFRGLPVLREHKIGSLRLLEAGCYEVTPATQTHDFRAGSYTGYSRWRVGVGR